MKSTFKAFVLLIPNLLHSQVASENYRLLPFNEILKERQDCIDPESDVTVCADIHRYKARVKYLGQVRKIKGKRAAFMEVLKKSWANQPGLVRVFSTYHEEVLFSFGDQQIWIPIQDSLISEIKKYVKPDHETLGYFLIPGSLKSGLMPLLTRFDEIDEGE